MIFALSFEIYIHFLLGFHDRTVLGNCPSITFRILPEQVTSFMNNCLRLLGTENLLAIEARRASSMESSLLVYFDR